MFESPPDLSRQGVKLAAAVAAAAGFGGCACAPDPGNWESSGYFRGVGLALLLGLAALLVTYLLVPHLLRRFPHFRTTGTDDPPPKRSDLRALVPVTAVTWMVIVGIGSFITQLPGTKITNDALPMALLGGLGGLAYGLVAAVIIWILRMATRWR